MLKGITQMYRLFGKNKRYCCAECQHYKKISNAYRNSGKTYRVCEIYGEDSGARRTGGNWKGTQIACGLAPNHEYTGERIRELIRAERKAKEETKDEGIPGQISLFM